MATKRRRITAKTRPAGKGEGLPARKAGKPSPARQGRRGASATAPVRGFDKSESVGIRLLAADRLLGSNDTRIEELGEDIGDLDFGEFEEALVALVKAGWASVESREADRTPIGGLASDEGDFYSIRPGAAAAFARAYKLWKESSAFDPNIDELLYSIPPERRQRPLAPGEARMLSFLAFREAAGASDVATLLKMIRKLDLRPRDGSVEDLDWMFLYMEAGRALPRERWHEVCGALVRECEGLVTCVAAEQLPVDMRGAALGGRTEELFRWLLDELGSFRPMDTTLGMFGKYAQLAEMLAQMQREPAEAYSSLVAALSAHLGSDLERALGPGIDLGRLVRHYASVAEKAAKGAPRG